MATALEQVKKQVTLITGEGSDRSTAVVSLMKLQCELYAELLDRMATLVGVLTEGEEEFTLQTRARVAKAKASSVPVQSIIDLYNSTVKHLKKTNVASNQLKANIRARWRTDVKYQTTDFWKYLFQYCDNHAFLSGRAEGKGDKQWSISLDDIVTERFWTKIQNKYYDN
jgi:hypothetical protein